MNIVKNQRQIGVDIGSSGIRLVEVERGPQMARLITFAAVPVKVGLAASDSAADAQVLTEALKNLVAQAKVGTKTAVACLSASEGFISITKMPPLPEKEIRKAIELQADKYFPMPLAQVNFDFTVLGPTPDNQQEVFMAAAPKAAAEKLARIVQGAGLELDAVEISAVAAARSLTADAGDVPVMIIDIGQTYTEISITQKAVPRVVRAFTLGMSALIKTAAQNLNVDEKQAEQFIRKFGVAQTKLDGQVMRSIKAPIDSLMGEIDKSVKFFSGTMPGVKIEKAILVGNGSAIPELPLYIANNAGIPVEIGNPWKLISYPAQLQDQLMQQAINFATASGLALRTMI